MAYLVRYECGTVFEVSEHTDPFGECPKCSEPLDDGYTIATLPGYDEVLPGDLDGSEYWPRRGPAGAWRGEVDR